jgi:hypothetical protein
MNFEAASLMLAAIGVLLAGIQTHSQLPAASVTNGAGQSYGIFLAGWPNAGAISRSA